MGSERAYQFFRLVERMRDKQKEYFRTRSAAVLNESKQLERDVDKEIKGLTTSWTTGSRHSLAQKSQKSEGWHDCKDKGDIPKNGEWCLLRAEYVCGGETIVDYLVALWTLVGLAIVWIRLPTATKITI